MTRARKITFVGGPRDAEHQWWDGGRTIEVFEKPVGALATDPPGATVEIEPTRGSYERDPANPYRFQWKGWDT